MGDTLLTFPLVEFFKKRKGYKVHFAGNTDYLILGEKANGGLIDKALPDVPKDLEDYELVITISAKPFLENSLWIYPFPREEEIYIVDYYLSKVGAEGFEYSKRLELSADLNTGGSDFADRENPLLGRIVLHPGSGSEKKNPPLEFYKRLYLRLVKSGKKPLFVLGEAERKLREELVGFETYEVKNILNFAIKLKGAKAFIGNDSGFSHLAGYLGVPTVALFGPTNPKIWKPIGEKVRVLYKGLKCSPCFPSECTSKGAYKECLLFDIEEVLKALEEVQT